MRISELARRSGVPVATVKYYLREHLLHEGERTSATQARYDEGHLSRLRLIRALLGAGRLTVASAREVLHAIDEPPDNMYALLGTASGAIGGGGYVADTQDHPHVHELMRRWGWPVEDKDCGSHAELARALAALDDAEFEATDELLDVYADRLDSIAEAEIAGVPTESAAAAVRYTVLGTVLVEPLLLVLRRMAQQAAAARRFAASGAEADASAPHPTPHPPSAMNDVARLVR